MSVQAIKAGAADFLTKPVTSDALAHAVRTAFDKDAADRVARAERAMLEWHLAMLTAREVFVAGASEDSTSRSLATSASSSRPSSSIARACNARRRARPPS